MEYTVDAFIRPDIKICQPQKNGFRFGCDSPILAYFSKLKKNDLIADAGSGSGVIGVLASVFYGVRVTAIEFQENMFRCLLKTIELNGLEERITAVLGDIKNYRGEKRFDAILCNPPYRKENSGRTSGSESERIARFSSQMDIDVLIKFCRTNLKEGGKLCFCYDADMLIEALARCSQARLEPKRLKFLYPSFNHRARLALAECVFGGGAELLVEPPLYQKGESFMTAEYDRIFSGAWSDRE